MIRLSILDWSGIQYAMTQLGSVIYPAGDYARWIVGRQNCELLEKFFVVFAEDDAFFDYLLEKHKTLEVITPTQCTICDDAGHKVRFTFASCPAEYLSTREDAAYYDPFSNTFVEATTYPAPSYDGSETVYFTVDGVPQSLLVIPDTSTPFERMQAVTQAVLSTVGRPGVYKIAVPLTDDSWYITKERNDHSVSTVSGQRGGHDGGGTPTGPEPERPLPDLLPVPDDEPPAYVRGSGGFNDLRGVRVYYPPYNTESAAPPSPAGGGEQSSGERSGDAGGAGDGSGPLPGYRGRHAGDSDAYDIGGSD